MECFFVFPTSLSPIIYIILKLSPLRTLPRHLLWTSLPGTAACHGVVASEMLGKGIFTMASITTAHPLLCREAVGFLWLTTGASQLYTEK